MGPAVKDGQSQELPIGNGHLLLSAKSMGMISGAHAGHFDEDSNKIKYEFNDAFNYFKKIDYHGMRFVYGYAVALRAIAQG